MNPKAKLVFEYAPNLTLSVRGKEVPEGAIHTVVSSPSAVNSRAPLEGTQWVMKGAYGFSKRMRTVSENTCSAVDAPQRAESSAGFERKTSSFLAETSSVLKNWLKS